MSHPTKAVYRYLMSDFVRVRSVSLVKARVLNPALMPLPSSATTAPPAQTTNSSPKKK